MIDSAISILQSGFVETAAFMLICLGAIVAGDLEYRYTGGAANGDESLSIGGATSSVEITTASDNNLFPDVTGDEASSGNTKYRCLALLNNHGSLTLQNSKTWFTSNTTSADDTLNMALSGLGLNTQAESTADEDTAPSNGESFTAPASKAAGLSVGNVPFSQYYPLWLQRVVDAAASAVDANAATIRWEGDTTA